MQPARMDLLRRRTGGVERRLRFGERDGTELRLPGGGVLWIADEAPDWAFQRMLDCCLGELEDEVRQGFGDRWSLLVPRPTGEVDL